MLNRAQLNDYGLDDWVAEFQDIYGIVNDQRRNIQDIWLHAVEHASELHEDLRIGEYGSAFDGLADLFCWLCAFTKRAHGDLEIEGSLHEIVLFKYPTICFYCSDSQCHCSATIGRGIEDKARKAELKKEALRRARIKRDRIRGTQDEPKSLRDIVSMFDRIYDHINFRTPLEIIMAHLQEEVGEVASSLNDFKDKKGIRDDVELRQELELEIADVVTWSVALFLKLDYVLGSGKAYLQRTGQIPDEPKKQNTRQYPPSLDIEFAEILWKRFQALPDGNTLWCPRCKDRPCSCDKARNK